MTTTTTIYKILVTELINNGLNYFRDPKTNKLVYLSENSLMNKILKYDNEVDDIVSMVFFNNNYLSNNECDIAFKYLWTSKFLNREIKFQSLPMFTAKNTSLFYQYSKMIESYFKDYEKYVTNYSESKQTNSNDSTTDYISDNTRKDTSKQNNIQSTLPQTEINMNTEMDTMSYADSNIISKGKNESESNTLSKNKNIGKGETNSVNRNYDLNKLILYKKSNLLNEILDDFDRQCFLQVW